MDLVQQIIERAKSNKQRIVLPEATEERTLRAADQVLAEGVADIILIGNPDEINGLAAQWGLSHIGLATIVDPENNPKSEEYAALLAELRKKKGMTIEKARELARKLKARFEVSFRVGIGSVKPQNQSIESYNEALNALIYTNGKVAHVDDMPIGCEYEDNYPVDSEKLLFDLTEKGNVNGAVAEANHYFDWMEENYSQFPMEVKLKSLEFALWAEHIAYESGGMTYRFRDRQDYLPTLMALEGMDSIRAWFVDKIANASRNISVKKEEQSVSVVDRAKQYIQKNYARDISLDDVSREVQISPYYFSKLFKEETGENFVEYVTQIRMAQAKELLDTTDLSMKEICGRIGYSDQPHV